MLLLLRLLRLDGLLRGWVWHLGGLVVLVGLMYSTGPWAWALAASIGVLVAGLLQLPWWRLAAVGVVMCAVSGVGFGFSTYQTQEAQRAQDAVENAESYGLQGERTPERVVGALLENIAQNDVPAFCGLLDVPARADVVRVTGAADCPGALAVLRSRASSPQYQHLDAPTAQDGTVWLTDACRTPWATPALGGQALGRIEVRRSDPPGGTYFVSRFLPADQADESAPRLTAASSICETSWTCDVLARALALGLGEPVGEHGAAERAAHRDRALLAARTRSRVSRASVVRLTLTRCPMRSSIHMRAPPAPQHIDRSAWRGISDSCAPAAPTSARGSS